MLKEIRSHADRSERFAFETTLSDRHYEAQLIQQWQSSGYRVKLFFLKLVSPDLAIAWVRQRILNGGHGVPESVIRRRFAIGLRNFRTFYRPLVNKWVLYDNFGDTPCLLEEGVKS